MALGSNSLSLARDRNSFRKSLRPCGYVPTGVALKDAGVDLLQDAKSVGTQPSTGGARHENINEHGTAQERMLRMDESLSDIFPAHYAFHLSRGYATFLRKPTTRECQKLRGFGRCGVSREQLLFVGVSLAGVSTICSTSRGSHVYALANLVSNIRVLYDRHSRWKIK